MPSLLALAAMLALGVALGAASVRATYARRWKLRSASSSELVRAREDAAIRLSVAAQNLREAQARRDEAVSEMRSREKCLLRRSVRLVELDRELGRRGEPTIVA